MRRLTMTHTVTMFSKRINVVGLFNNETQSTISELLLHAKDPRFFFVFLFCLVRAASTASTVECF